MIRTKALEFWDFREHPFADAILRDGQLTLFVKRQRELSPIERHRKDLHEFVRVRLEAAGPKKSVGAFLDDDAFLALGLGSGNHPRRCEWSPNHAPASDQSTRQRCFEPPKPSITRSTRSC